MLYYILGRYWNTRLCVHMGMCFRIIWGCSFKSKVRPSKIVGRSIGFALPEGVCVMPAWKSYETEIYPSQVSPRWESLYILFRVKHPKIGSLDSALLHLNIMRNLSMYAIANAYGCAGSSLECYKRFYCLRKGRCLYLLVAGAGTLSESYERFYCVRKGRCLY